jgi:hypothetical protein
MYADLCACASVRNLLFAEHTAVVWVLREPSTARVRGHAREFAGASNCICINNLILFYCL